MAWTIEVTENAAEEIADLPEDMQARFIHIGELLIAHGPSHVGGPHVDHIRGKLWEMRMKGKDGIARAIYFTASSQRIVVVRAFVKKTPKTPNREIDLAMERMDQFNEQDRELQRVEEKPSREREDPRRVRRPRK